MTKQNISESNKIYHQLFTNSPNSIVLMNLEGKIVDCNLSQEKIFGYKKDELIGKDFRELNVFTDEYLPIATKHFKNLLKGNSTKPQEVQIYKKDGDLKWVLLQANLIKINKKPIIQTIAQDITAIKEAEQKLKLSEKKYERIIKHLDIGYFKSDEDGKIIDHNPQFGKILGYEKVESLIGVPAIDLWDNPKDFNKYREELIEKRMLRDYIHRARKKNGDRIILHTHSHLYENKEKKRYEAEGTIFDITEKFDLEQKLKESEKNYRNIIENVQDAIIIFGLDGRLKYISPQLTKILGKEIKLGTRAFDGIHPDDEKNLVKAFKRAVKEKGTFTNDEFEFRAIHNDGHYIWLSSLTKNYYDDEGNLEGFIALLKDITEKKEAQRKLIESEKKYQSIIENSKDAIIVIGLDGKFKYVSPQLSNILGREVNLQSQFFRDIHPEDLNNLMELFSIAIKQKEVLIDQEVEFRALHHNGHYIWMSSSSKTFHDENEKVIGFITLLRDITEKKEAEKKLVESEKKYREILNNIEQGYYEVDLRGNYIFTNQFQAKYFGLTPDEMIGKSYKDLYDKETKKRLFEIYNEIYRKDIPKTIREIEIVGPDGIKHTYETSIYLKRDSNTKKIGFYGATRDISERKEMEKILVESEKKYREILDNLEQGYYEVDLNGTYTLVNEYFAKFYGYSPDEMIGKSYKDIYDRETENDIFQRYNQVYRENIPKMIIEFESTRLDGIKRTIESIIYLKHDSNGKKIGFYGTIYDISERKEAELKIKESEEKYRLISENANDLIMILDKRGNFLYCNEAFEKVMGFPPEELLGKYAGDFAHPDDLNQVIEDFQNTISHGRGMNIARFICKDGTYKWIESKGNFTYDEENNPIGDLVVARDISERREMEEKLKKSEMELRKLNIELEQKVRERTKELEKKNIELTKLDKAKDDFITMAAHELKTPLISIAGYTDYILTTHMDDLTVDVKNDLLIVQRNIDRLQNLMNQLLDVMKIESHKIELNLNLENISNIIYRCLHELNYLFKEKDHEMVLNLDNEILINIDSNRIFQVFSNLISNATKFTPKGGRIEISAEKEAMYYIFKVKDNGIGLLEEDFERIFKKFETIERMTDTYNQTGSGLGLYISKGFVEGHGGKMWANSEGLNKGTTIQFTIPI